MWKNRFLILVVFVGVVNEADGLIGLRPARQDPRFKEQEAHKELHPLNNQSSSNTSKSHSQQTKTLRFIVNVTDSHTSCHPVPLLRCTYRYLRQSLINESTSCHRIDDFVTCATSVVRSEGRRSFITGLSFMTDLSSQAQRYLGCEVISSTHVMSGHTRHKRTKRSSSQCCTKELLNCAAQTVTKTMTIHPSQQCHIINFYNSCVRTFEDLCDSRTVLTTFEILRLQLQKLC